MAIPILNHMDFGIGTNKAEIRNVRLHNVAQGSVSNPGTGQIIYDSGTLKFYNGSAWVSLGTSNATGDITGVDISVGTGLDITQTNTNAGDYSSTISIDISEFSAVTPASGDSFLTLDSDGSTEQLTTVSALQTYMQNNLTFKTDTNLTEEEVEDFVGGMVTGNTETGITVTYEDSDGTLDFVVADTTVAGDSGSTGITPGDTLTIAGGSNVTTAMSGDTLTITATNTNTQLSDEQVQDIVGAMVTGNTESGITVTYQDSDGTLDFAVGTLNQDTTGTAAKVTVSDSTANTNFPVVFHDEGTGNVLLDDTGALRYNPSTGTLLVPNLNVSGTTTQVDTVTMEAQNAIVFEGATSDAHETTLTITDPTADRTITLQNASGTVAFTSDITGTNSGTNTGDQLVFKTVTSDSGSAVADTTTDTLTLSGGEGIDTSASGDTITIAGEDASTSNKGIASFSSDNFAVSSGAVTIKDGGVSNDELVNSSITINGSAVSLGGSVTTPNTQLSFASAAEVQAGTNTTKAINPDKLAAKSVHATIDVSDSQFTSNLYAEITHGLGTEDVIVQLFDSSSKETVFADVARTDKSNSASTSKVKITFAAAPSNDIEVLITSIKGSTAGTVAYS